MSSENSQPLILLVEDSEDDAYFFRRIMKEADSPCRLVHVTDGIAAIEALEKGQSSREHRPDLIFLDLKLPNYDGFDILRWIQEKSFMPPIPTAVLSGSEREDDISRAKSLGAKHYFSKPLLIDQFRRMLVESGIPHRGAS